MSNLHLIHNRNSVSLIDINLIIDDFLSGKAKTTQEAYRSAWKHFHNWWQANYPNKNLLDITPLQAQKYFLDYETRSGQSCRVGSAVPVAKSTLKKIAAILVSCLNAVKMELRIDFFNPFVIEFKKFQGINSKNRRPTKLTPFAQVKRLVEAPSQYTKIGIRDRAVLSALYGGGLRRGELVKLRMCHIKFEKSGLKFVLLDTKNGDDADQPIARELSEAIVKYYNQRLQENPDPNAFFFIDYRGKYDSPQEGKPLSTSSVYGLFKHWAKEIGLPKEITPHSARATAITRLLDKGLSHRQVCEFSRHRSVQMVEAYDKKRGDNSLNPGDLLSFDDEPKKKKNRK